MKIAFIGNDQVAIDIENDYMLADNGVPVQPSVPLYEYASKTPGWNIEEDMDGNKCLTRHKTTGSPYAITVTRGTTQYSYSNVELIGGRPPVRR